VRILGLMVGSTKEAGRSIKCMARECLLGRMAKDTKGIMSEIRNKEWVFFFGIFENSILSNEF
jgi:hypothetical protein